MMKIAIQRSDVFLRSAMLQADFVVDSSVVHERINAAVRKAQENPALRDKLTGIGTTVRSETLEQFRATVKADRAKWAEIVKASGAKID